MSFGWSVGEIVAMTNLALKLALSTKKASGTWDSLSREMSGFHVVLNQLQGELIKPGTVLNRAGETKRTELMTLYGECIRVLNKISQVLERYNGILEGKKGFGAKSWQKGRYIDGEPAELRAIRYDITTCKNSITIFLAPLSVGELAVVDGETRLRSQTRNMIEEDLDGNSKYEGVNCLDPVQDEHMPRGYEDDNPVAAETQSLQFSSDERSLSARSTQHVIKDRLDPSYSVRNRDYLKFFKVGKVFTTLWTEGYGGTTHTRDSFVSTVVYGEQVHSKIRRFVVVRKADRSCVCLPITVVPSKPHSRKLQSLNLAEHGIVFSNAMPEQLDGINLRPVRVQAAKGNSPFRDYSLVDYARPCTIEMNVKVKEVGTLEPESRAVLMANFKQVFVSSMESDTATPLTPKSKFAELVAPMQQLSVENENYTIELGVDPERQIADIVQPHQGEHVEQSGPRQNSFSLIHDLRLDPRFCIIGQPVKFYRIGRVFKTLWSEPAGGTAKDMDKSFYSKVGFDELVFTKIRRFIVVREKTHSCLCLPLYTYGGQGSLKPDVRAQDHVAVRISTNDPPPTPRSTEEDSQKTPLGIIVEDSEEKIDPMTRINFGQVFTIQHNLKVAKVGRIHPTDIERLNKYFIESVIT
ncbi:hypothetical protein BKA64DRAFT_748480 [Cadophora sp. MPI-SDFR-AT-0126]|nr:hypothetical protein BKA64DRAFT_748480 [Leotiomycetes sp. MPI-SDFR-AT-0126]